MSADATKWAWSNLDKCGSPGEKLTLLALAWKCDEQGVTWVGPRLLMEMTQLEHRGLKRCMSKLCDLELITRYRRMRKDGSDGSGLTVLNMNGEDLDLDAYQFVLGEPEGRVVRKPPPGGPGDHARGASTPPPTRSTTESLLPSGQEGEGALERVKPVTYNRRRVPPPIVEGAEELLKDFNEATGRSLGARGADGNASPPLRQIIGAMLARPEVGPDVWAEGIRNTVTNPPGWVGDRVVQIGDVFGDRAAEWAFSNKGKVAARTAKDPAKQKRVDNFMEILSRHTGVPR